MQKDRRVETILECLQYAICGKIGKNIKKSETYKYITEIYPYKDGFFMLYTIEDSRALLFQERKMLVYISSSSSIEILGECDLRNSQCIDTCVTEEFIDAKYTYENMIEGTESLFFKKKYIKRLDESIEFCKRVANIAFENISQKEKIG